MIVKVLTIIIMELLSYEENCSYLGINFSSSEYESDWIRQIRGFNSKLINFIAFDLNSTFNLLPSFLGIASPSRLQLSKSLNAAAEIN